ncbi:hypothetical protein BDV95DRAFT_568055 [Massariosphaeria phaeospora]|uniref:Uncharacterized protein n=1 Tax=Massariosphaeria phaeospora TaxID=100035 RepID=A0A7C8IH64_9PLEO|nr:hypothetical protein BDV95DRAFT_568055 [Massariosphaeria phaeospora]
MRKLHSRQQTLEASTTRFVVLWLGFPLLVHSSRTSFLSPQLMMFLHIIARKRCLSLDSLLGSLISLDYYFLFIPFGNA